MRVVSFMKFVNRFRWKQYSDWKCLDVEDNREVISHDRSCLQLEITIFSDWYCPGDKFVILQSLVQIWTIGVSSITQPHRIHCVSFIIRRMLLIAREHNDDNWYRYIIVHWNGHATVYSCTRWIIHSINNSVLPMFMKYPMKTRRIPSSLYLLV